MEGLYQGNAGSPQNLLGFPNWLKAWQGAPSPLSTGFCSYTQPPTRLARARAHPRCQHSRGQQWPPARPMCLVSRALPWGGRFHLCQAIVLALENMQGLWAGPWGPPQLPPLGSWSRIWLWEVCMLLDWLGGLRVGSWLVSWELSMRTVCGPGTLPWLEATCRCVETLCLGWRFA